MSIPENQAMIKAVIDTNIFWVSISRRSSSHWLFEKLIKGEFILPVTTEILSEYEEMISQRMGAEVANAVMETLDCLPNVELITRYYQWRLVTADPDDDKFVDRAVACNADFLVTHDSHFNAISRIPFPKVNVVDLKTFQPTLTF
ncbi:putative toxin-antitoxin system toxin component, PIN family [Dyadobacter luticola]|uniref:Putative toxin-antitoxin system toxin component, PIN family n=1 Tax=Dyadobacter luticola TaxID=1979387 RepID=A0A5R9KWI6_9BACT|nr:putative toxin-antitoxin system toxin component, PIN family [Dyadobacter luticola]TLV00614.1 putative toxin-antitoxin system toxin component, PIN family [Dyadobacter luticola]